MGKKKKNIWYYLKEGGLFLLNTGLVFLPEILGEFPEYTIAGKIAGGVGYAWRMLEMRKNYMQNTLPEAMTNLLDRVPNKITGEKGSKLPGGLSKNQIKETK